MRRCSLQERYPKCNGTKEIFHLLMDSEKLCNKLYSQSGNPDIYQHQCEIFDRRYDEQTDADGMELHAKTALCMKSGFMNYRNVFLE